MARYLPANENDQAALLLKGEAANLLRISPSTFRRMEKAGELPPPVKVGPRYLYRRADLLAALATDCESNQDADVSRAILDAVTWG